MSATVNQMLGVRLPDAVAGAGGEGGWRHWNNGNCLRGAYMKVLNFDGKVTLWKVRTPSGEFVDLFPEDVGELDDQTITVVDEIVTAEWRGRLENGRWFWTAPR